MMRLVDACGQSIAGLHEETKRTELKSVPRIAQTASATKCNLKSTATQYSDFGVEICARQVHNSTGCPGSTVHWSLCVGCVFPYLELAVTVVGHW